MEQAQVDKIKAMPFEVLPEKDKQAPMQDHLFKLIIIGDTGVGKSCLMKRVVDNEFQEQHQVTIGVEFGTYGMKIDEKIIKLQIWDTAGQESFKSVTRIFYKGAHCVFLTYDITRDETFDNLRSWLQEIKQHAAQDVKIYLIGNKSELEHQREVQFDRAVEFAKSQGIHKCFETSARTGQNVEEVFSCAGKELFSQAVSSAAEEAENLKNSAAQGQGKGKSKKSNDAKVILGETKGKSKDQQKKDGCKC